MRAHQRGAAILTAMLVVVLVATLASAMLWQQWRSVAVEGAQRTRVQANWILTGALDWARLILREDARQGGPDHLGEPWAVPLEPARLSTFLAAKDGQALVTDDGGDALDVFLAGQVQDAQARLNLINLLEADHLHGPTLAVWTRLFEQLDLPVSELESLTAALLRAQDAKRSGARPLWPQQVRDLAWWGLSPTTLRTLTPHITLLPDRTLVNLNTTSATLVRALVPDLDAAAARALVQARARAPLHNLDDARRALGTGAAALDGTLMGVNSRFFLITGQLRVPGARIQEQSLLQRDGLRVTVVWRQRQAVPTPSDATAEAGQVEP